VKRSGREVMKGEMEGKWKIAGTAIAVMIVASVFMVMMPVACARDPDGAINDGDTLFIGEHGLHFDTSLIPANSKCELKKIEDSTVVETIVIDNSSDFYIPDDVEEDGYRVYYNQNWVANVTIKKPKITANIYIEGTTDSIVGEAVPVGTNITIRVMPNFGGLMNASKPEYQGNWSKVKIILTPPPGKGAPREFVVNATKSEIDVGPDPTKNDVQWPFLDTDTEGWDPGEWTVKIEAIPEYCNEVNVKSDEYKFTIRSEKLTIEAEKTTVDKGEKILLTVSGNPNAYYYFVIENVKSGEEPQIQDTADIEARGVNNTRAWIKTGSDGVATIEIKTTNADERTYTMHVFGEFKNATLAGCAGWPDFSCFPDADEAEKGSPEDDDEVDVKVEAAKVTFDIPASVVIGEKLKIKGSISAGDYVDIVIRDEEVVADDEPVDENKEFEVEWDTSNYMPGSYTIDVYIDFKVGGPKETLADYEGVDEDDSTVIRLVAPGLTAEQLRNVIAEGDDYSFEGTATGVDDVDYVLIGPKGTRTGNVNDIREGLLIDSTSVSDNSFSEDVEMTEGLDTGMWICMILAPGRDGVYGDLEDLGAVAGNLKEAFDGDLGDIDLKGKSQDQIKAMILDHTVNVAGSDDLLQTFTFKVESAYVRFNPVESVMVGEPLNVSGVTNREPGTTITISTFAGPTILDTVLAEVEWPTSDEGVFSATIDTTNAVPGTYTLEADDGDGHTDTITVEILAAVPSPTPSPTLTVSPTPTTPTPTPTPTPSPAASPVAPTTPSPTPSPSPSPTPGFEAIFAVAGLLAVTYFVLRRKK